MPSVLACGNSQPAVHRNTRKRPSRASLRIIVVVRGVKGSRLFRADSRDRQEAIIGLCRSRDTGNAHTENGVWIRADTDGFEVGYIFVADRN